jgi:hypothetical protein
MGRFSVSLLFILASAFTLAQVSPTTFTLRSSDTSGCPVGFYASRRATGQIMSAGDARQAGPGQGLHLTLSHLTNTPADIQSIEVTVYGTSPKARVLPLAQKASDTVSQTFAFHRTSGNPSLTDADVWMHQVGSLTAVDLNSVTYADGTTWHSTSDMQCRAIPSNFVLVTKR